MYGILPSLEPNFYRSPVSSKYSTKKTSTVYKTPVMHKYITSKPLTSISKVDFSSLHPSKILYVDLLDAPKIPKAKENDGTNLNIHAKALATFLVDSINLNM